ncbi:chemotaxis protein CheW [Pseudohongiella spirulinae]|uniref:Chemotaxis protein CheW n=1 Tax=Pseudohongiella spirulinae TaxID=1249552 RepID=A0A0S2KAB4_9GAMM|nr:chemotaxis protein CheW [Pseudohongiella spirulinae]ALO45226.1 chemotaxis protein CheW [Pseudohongiella spirulinae]
MSTSQALAVEQHDNDDDLPRDVIKHVSFALGEETYAINAATVNEVLRHTEITPVPGSPAFILGIINLRGNVVTVIDARQVFALPPRELSSQSRIIVVEVEDFIVGVLVDRVVAVVDLEEAAIETAPQTGQDASARFIHSVYNEEDELLILVDFSRVVELLPR